jgi:hypothetical protein
VLHVVQSKRETVAASADPSRDGESDYTVTSFTSIVTFTTTALPWAGDG